MTVAALPSSISYAENGVTTNFPAPFRFKTASDLVVERLGGGVATVLTLGVDYTVTGGTTDSGGAVTRTAATTGATLRIRRRTARAQGMVYTAGDRFPAKSHEGALDLAMLIDQEQDDAIADLTARALVVGVGETALTLPAAAARTNRLLGFGALGAIRLSAVTFDQVEQVVGAAFAPGLTQFAANIAWTPPGAETTTVDAVLRQSAACVHHYRYAIETTDTSALARALATGKAVRFAGGQGAAGDGAYLIENAPLAAGAMLFGDGPGRTIIREPDTAGGSTSGTEWGVFNVRSAAYDQFVDNITIRDLRIEGLVTTKGFLEWRYLMFFRGVRRLLIDNVHFVGFRGDGVCFGGEGPTFTDGSTASQYRHNSDVTIRGCLFDGINRNNRNAVSVVDGQRIAILASSFRNVSKSGGGGALDPFNPATGGGMPGAIDFEPNGYPGYLIGDCIVADCDFANVGGTNGAISVFLPTTLTTQPACFQYLRNRMRGASRDYFIQRPGFVRSDSSHDHRILIAGHDGQDGGAPMFIDQIKGVTIRDSAWTDYASEGLLGYSDPGRRVHTVAIQRSRFLRCGTSANGGNGRAGLTVFQADRLTLQDNEFVDCANGESAAYSAGIFFYNGSSTGVRMERNTIRNVTGNTRRAVAVYAHTLDLATNYERGNIYGTLANDFRATYSDVAQAFPAAVEGNTAAGVATFTDRGSRYRVEGRTCHVEYFEQWSAHTGTGLLKVALPLPMDDGYNGPGGYSAPVLVELDGATIGAGIVIAQANSAVMMSNGVAGTLLFFAMNAVAGTNAGVNVPAAATLRVRLAYPVKAL